MTKLNALYAQAGFIVVAAAAAARVHRSTLYRWKAQATTITAAANEAPNKSYADPVNVCPEAGPGKAVIF
ncbi:hypothetical protein ON010_g6475 [Phytophthora cinnamomi]|nr:hypothetical protein ON010_g6475 [Phytophthora cinnamomi]